MNEPTPWAGLQPQPWPDLEEDFNLFCRNRGSHEGQGPMP
jgi:hypothetical protein